MPMPYYPPPQSDSTKIIIVIIVIMVVIFVVIPIILAALIMFTMPIPDDIELTPTAAMNFVESNTEPGVYMGGVVAISDTVDLEDVALVLIDDSLRASAFMDPLEDDATANITGGLGLTFNDANRNGRLDPADIFTVRNGSEGDTIRLTFRPTGDLIGEFDLT
jgi:FlaG/FlaF family flagellin (archaellin)